MFGTRETFEILDGRERPYYLRVDSFAGNIPANIRLWLVEEEINYGTTYSLVSFETAEDRLMFQMRWC